ncbi:hypothetical protein PG310_11035 [Riemerella anatipestifer]|uniref:hypothetical protein n=1 Tax=Bergeyella anatis TaxID=3113737 RepID=UPI002A8DF298|nr:hypothetical protein [Riemerella anatipestifer]MEC5395873.1 hypothetical protein [Bergeyella sp. RCAD1439]
MKQITAYILLIGTIVMTLTYMSDLYEMYINKRFYEGYLFAVKVFMFDIAMIIPLIISLAIKNTNELKIWSVLSVILQNIVLILGFKIGAIYAVCLGVIMTTVFILNFKKFNLKNDATNIN